MSDIQYKGLVIEVQSHKSDGDRWRPKAIVTSHERGSLHTHTVPAPLSVMFDTEQSADAYAVEMAKKWIDERG
jgi:hypothetical protein